jgi:type III restriction enzyme
MKVKKDLAQTLDVPVVRQAVIENPIINSPFDEPTRHFRFSDEGITNEEVDSRRTSSYFVPIAEPKKKRAKQLQFDTEWLIPRYLSFPRTPERNG